MPVQRRLRGSIVAILVLTAGATAAVAIADDAPPAEPVVVRGTVVGSDGQPAARGVQVYAPGGALLAEGSSGADGRFELGAIPGGTTGRRLAGNDGNVTLRVETASEVQRRPQAVMRRWTGKAWEGAGQTVTLQDADAISAHQADDDSPRPTGEMPRCKPLSAEDLTHPKKWTVIGQMNPNRGVKATFNYARERSDEISFGVNPDFKAVAIGGGTLDSKRSGTFDGKTKRTKGRYRVLALVKYEREIQRYDSGSKKGKRCSDVAMITPQKVYEKDLRVDSRGVDPPEAARGDCRNRRAFKNGFWERRVSGDTWGMTSSKARTNVKGASVAGVGFDTQSGYSTNVTITYEFGSKNRPYMICGIGGETEDGIIKPSSWTMAWAGY